MLGLGDADGPTNVGFRARNVLGVLRQREFGSQSIELRLVDSTAGLPDLVDVLV
jgi:hypothetical protein